MEVYLRTHFAIGFEILEGKGNFAGFLKLKQFSMRKYAFPIALVVLVLGLFLIWRPLKYVYFSNVSKELSDPFLCIPSGSSFEDLSALLINGGYIQDEAGFRWVAEQMNFVKPEMRAGRFKLEPGWSNRALIKHLRAGEQASVKVVLNIERIPEDIAGSVSRFIEADSASILAAFRDSALLAELGYTPETIISVCIPNTYEMYWNTDGAAFLKRMLKENKSFWEKNNRKAKAEALQLTPVQVYTLASIVERESNHQPERPTIAGVYLNRLKIGMLLQADPTSVFATKDFGARRVTNFHTGFDSPYNTYRYKGLPPGPISMASISSIDAVLNFEKHNYLYFCAKPDESGQHAFASTLAGHNVNADRFRAWLKTRLN